MPMDTPLENLVKGSLATYGQRKGLELSGRVDLAEFGQIIGIPNPAYPGGAPHIPDHLRPYAVARGNEEAAHAALDTGLGATDADKQTKYDELKGELFDKLSDNGKVAVYLSLLDRGVLPDTPSDDLKKVAGTYDAVQEAQRLAAKDVMQAYQFLGQAVGIAQEGLRGILNVNFAESGSRTAAEHLVQGGIAGLSGKLMKELKEKPGLGTELMSTVLAKKEFANAVGVMYSIYNSKQEKDYRDAQAAARARP